MGIPTLLALAMVVVRISEAVDPDAVIGVKAHFGHFLVDKASAVIHAKQNLILSGTHALLAAKQHFIQKQLPHLLAFKAKKANSIIHLKKNLLSTTAAHLGQIHITSGGGDEIPKLPNGPQPAQPELPYGPPPPPPVLLDTPILLKPSAPVPSFPTIITTNRLPAEPILTAAAPPPTCVACSQSNSGPMQVSAYRPGAHVQPAPPSRPQTIYGPPSRPQTTYGTPSRPQASLAQPSKPHTTYGPPQSYSIPANHNPGIINTSEGN